MSGNWSTFSERVNVLFHVNKQCNLLCRHCFMGSTATTTEQVEFDKIVEIIGDLRDMNVEMVGISGGEPTLRKDAIDILKAVKDAKFEPFLVSNGTLIDDDYAARLEGIVNEVLISLDGHRERHDLFRGVPGTYDKAMRAIEALKNHNIPFSLQFTVTKESYEYVDSMAELASDMGAKTLKLEPLFLMGRASEIDENILTQRDLESLNQKTMILHGKYLASTNIAMGIHSASLLKEHPCNVYACSGDSCHRKATKEPRDIIIMPDGTTLPFDVGIHPSYAIGNVVENRAVDVFKNYVGSPQHERLIDLCKRVFKEYIANYPFTGVPWESIIAKESWREQNE